MIRSLNNPRHHENTRRFVTIALLAAITFWMTTASSQRMSEEIALVGNGVNLALSSSGVPGLDNANAYDAFPMVLTIPYAVAEAQHVSALRHRSATSRRNLVHGPTRAQGVNKLLAGLAIIQGVSSNSDHHD
jgi:hypothetical protein